MRTTQSCVQMRRSPRQYRHPHNSKRRSQHQHPHRAHHDFSFNLWLSLARKVIP
jgi:hypothetical protein